MSELTLDGTAQGPVSRDRILTRERRQGFYDIFPSSSADARAGLVTDGQHAESCDLHINR